MNRCLGFWGNGQALLSKKAQLIPVSALEPDAAVHDIEESTASQAFRIAPLENYPVAILKQVLDKTGHLGPLQLALQHCAYRLSTGERFPHDLVIDRVL